MQIVYHLGAHFTDEERLLRCLLRNRAVLAEQGIAVPGPSRYRNLLRDTAASLGRRPASGETQNLVLEQILESDAPTERLILSWDNFMAFPQWAIRGGLYPRVGTKLQSLTQVLPDHPAEFHLALRNPAGFIPALLGRLKDKTYADLMQDLNAQDIFWSDVLNDIAQANPTVPIHVWCDEDSPLVWPEVLMTVSGHNAQTLLEGRDDLLADLMTGEGFAALQAEMAARPPGNGAERRHTTAEFLNRHARPERMEMAIDLPGWNAELVDTLTRQYDQDMERIRRIPGVIVTMP